MNPLTSHAEQIAEDLAQEHGFSVDAVRHMIRAIDAGWGGMASFDHPEFGGPGQWMRGGMIMLSEPFDHMLRARVDALCNEIAGVYEAENNLVDRAAATTGDALWPAALGTPTTTGSQGDTRYAWFAQTRRLATIRHGRLRLFDTGDHRITGVAQQQTETNGDVSFISQHGTIDPGALTPIDADHAPASDGSAGGARASPPHAADAIAEAIERLGELRDRGLLTEDEFTAKKTELLARL